MSILSEFFAATASELEAMSLEWGPAPPPPQPPKASRGFFGFGRKSAVPEALAEPAGPTLPSVAASGILEIHVGILDKVVTGTPYDVLEQGGRPTMVRDNGEDGPWVFPIRRELRDGLSHLDDGTSTAVAQRWADDEDVHARDEVEKRAIQGLLDELRGLAATAVATNRDLFLWVSL